jgi:hypothetical protein
MDPEAIKDAVDNYLTRHRALCPDPVCHELENVLAFIGHTMGLRADNLAFFIERLRVYEERCPGCAHKRN